MNIDKLNELKGKRASLLKDMRALSDIEATRALNADEQAKYAAMEKDLDVMSATINRAENLNAAEAKLRDQRDNNYRADLSGVTGKSPRSTEQYKNAFFDGYVRRGKNGLSVEHVNALQVGTDSEGGYLVPEEFASEIITKLVELDPIRASANVITTASDRNFPVETGAGTFAYIDEEASYSESDPALGRVTVSAFKAGGIIKVSEELLQDSLTNVPAYLSDVAARRYNALEASKFCVGTGTGMPLGLFAATAVAGTNLSGYTGAVSATAAITADDLVETYHTLPIAYRARAKWVTGDTIVKMIRKLKTGVSGDNTYLWQPGLVAGQPDTILGRPVIVSDGAVTPAANAKSIIFGDLSRYTIVERLGMTVQRLNELYAANGQIGFKFTKRNDARLVDPAAFVFFKHGAAS